MSVSLRSAALVALALLVVGVLENVAFGSDTPGAAHVVSVGFFFLSVVAALALIVIGVVALARRASTTRVR